MKLSSQHAHGFQVVDCKVIFRGYCPACISKKA
jgi:Fe2+ or Zn2+ uptake regulation protein